VNPILKQRIAELYRLRAIEQVADFSPEGGTHVFLKLDVDCPARCGRKSFWLIIRGGEIRCADCDRAHQLAQLPANVRAIIARQEASA